MQQLKHDGSFDISIGRWRKETAWKNREWNWSALLEKLETTRYTEETQAVYAKLKKDRQDEIKDIGGFVGGYLANGRRKSHSVVHRQLITLDLDFSPVSIWDDYTLQYHYGAAFYSTHKHSNENPRYRLIMPLSRPVFPDEYVAIARKVAGVLGIDYFDDTTFQPERMMYWPSTSSDGDYVFEYQDGPWLDADEILASYYDWKDASEWPVSSRVSSAIRKAMTKQGDPLEKKGIVGAFCNSYSIADAIETFLDDVYEPCAIESRYTYKEGSTSAGLVVYEDKFAFSHHGTDPVSGKLCNAFDLVRLHKFGLQDEDAKEGTPGNKLPSYQAMIDFAGADKKVRIHLNAERLEKAREDFEDVGSEGEAAAVEIIPVGDDSWLGKLETDRYGNNNPTINNILLILQNDLRLKGAFALDLFENREVALKSLPWRKVTHATRYLTDSDDDGLWHLLENNYGISNVSKTKAALSQVLRDNSFHPVKDYLQSLTWDGEERLDSLFIDYLGAADSDYVRTVTRKMFVAAVARIYKPGIKFDNILVTVGPEGKGKSHLIDQLGGCWFSDSFSTVQGKEAYEQIQGIWLVEIAELAGLRKHDAETQKHFISKREDRFRVAYGRRVENFPRQCVFFGTGNNRDFLRNASGNRRFWPVDILITKPVKHVFTDITEDERGQIWAEALHRYQNGEQLFLSPEMEAEANRMQEEHTEQDERTGMIQQYLETLLPASWESMGIFERRAWLQSEDDLKPEGRKQRTKVCVAEIWCEVLGGQQKEMTRANTKDIHALLRTIKGWEEAKAGKNRFSVYGLQKAYLKVTMTLDKSVKTGNTVKEII